MKCANLVFAATLMLVCWLLPEKIVCQELELFELDDFIDPRVLRTNLSGEPIEPAAFFTARTYFGVDYNYQYRGEFTKTDIAFARFTNNFYYKNIQLNWKLAYLEELNVGTERHSNLVPAFKNRLQFGTYSYTVTDDDPDPPADGRFQLSWNMEGYDNSEIVHEFTLDIDVTVQFPEGPAFGGFVWGWKPWEHEHYLAFAYRYSGLSWENGSELRWGIGQSYERVDDDWHWGVFRLQSTIDLAILPRHGFVQVIASISRSFAQKEWNLELGTFANVTILERLFLGE